MIKFFIAMLLGLFLAPICFADNQGLAGGDSPGYTPVPFIGYRLVNPDGPIMPTPAEAYTATFSLGTPPNVDTIVEAKRHPIHPATKY
ncbi:hypothetical protein [Chitinimonas sp. BJB300]|uniref:hypothetical protein n=1 Tax=Chitinimonas sp. BJB300 TaxID=1559339 RepID=UPI0011122D4F|nr:hypothetical protein [Chitinimonas sp. BJB300]TSJ84551.1 hypothetical protein FG002_019660 [Chitinimonas sp. BJB300]